MGIPLAAGQRSPYTRGAGRDRVFVDNERAREKKRKEAAQRREQALASGAPIPGLIPVPQQELAGAPETTPPQTMLPSYEEYCAAFWRNARLKAGAGGGTRSRPRLCSSRPRPCSSRQKLDMYSF